MNDATIALLIVFLPILTVIIFVLAALTIFFYRRGYFARPTAVIPPIRPVFLDRGSSIFNDYIELQTLPPVITCPETPIHERRLPYYWVNSSPSINNIAFLQAPGPVRLPNTEKQEGERF